MSTTLTHMPTSSPVTTPLPTATIVTCVEYGPLEQMVVRMVDSLRRWGGRLADAPVYAVKPRRGMPLTRELEHFIHCIETRDAHGARHVALRGAGTPSSPVQVPRTAASTPE